MGGGLPIPEPLAPLEELYRCVSSADGFGLKPTHAASLLRSYLCAQGSGVRALTPHDDSASLSELYCVSLTVLEQLLCHLTKRRGGAEFHLFAEETWSLLQPDIMGTLLQMFDSEDLFASHLGVMCASAAVIYQLYNTGLVNGEWSRWCVQAWHGPPGPQVYSCVRSLTEVLRRLLKGAHYELADKVVIEFDSSMLTFCPWWLSAVTEAGFDGWGSSVTLVVDLLEVLCACRSGSAQGTTLSSQCLLCLCSMKLLALCSCAEPVVKKRVLLLLKRAIMQRAGEDWLAGHQGQLCTDIHLLAHRVLRTAAEGCLKGISLEGVTYFGGTVLSEPSVDSVTLRALCLILLKSMELQDQLNTPVSLEEPVPLTLCLQSLWDIISMDSTTQSSQPPHCCFRLSLVFGEQDDDMMEAARALLCIFLHRWQDSTDTTSVLLWACSLGLNPHCHFLCLLSSLAFDHRVLLDFLISTETCFLEYFVRYLRFLRTDIEGFVTACSRVCLKQLPRRDGGNRGFRRTGSSGGVVDIGVAKTSQGCGVHLVDYSSSGDSDTEEMERTADSERAQHRDRDCFATAVGCLCLLQELVSRLHCKNLFPYNPSSLIKLLTDVEASLKSRLLK